MTELHHDRFPNEGETAQHTAPTQRPGDARPSDTATAEPRPTNPLMPRARRGRQGIPRTARRRAVHLPAALVGAGSLGLLVARDRVALAEEPVAVESASVNVAEELGLHAGRSIAIPEADATARLGELTASRTAREAEQDTAAPAQAEADRLAAEAIAEAARPDAVLPVDGGRLTSGLGVRCGTVHAGIDLAAPMRTPEYAAMDGVVLEAGPASGYGLAVYLQHDNGDVTVYGHMGRSSCRRARSCARATPSRCSATAASPPARTSTSRYASVASEVRRSTRCPTSRSAASGSEVTGRRARRGTLGP